MVLYCQSELHRVSCKDYWSPPTTVPSAVVHWTAHVAHTLAPQPPDQTSTRQTRRRHSSAAKAPSSLNLQESSPLKTSFGATSGLPANGFAQLLPTIPGTPTSMSLSRSPSPQRGGGWASPGLTAPFDTIGGTSTPRKGYGEIHVNGGVGNSVTWATAKARSEEINGYPSFSPRKSGWFSRHARKISNNLPSFTGRRDFAEKEKLGRGRWYPGRGSRSGRLITYLGSMARRFRLRLLLVIAIVLALSLFYITCEITRGFQYSRKLLTDPGSSSSRISANIFPGRWKQICYRSGRESRRRSHGMERSTGMGD